MIPRSPRIFTIASSAPFLDVLAAQVLDGFPLESDAGRPILADWTILLPTRRAAREFTQILAIKSRQSTILLPKVMPIGDLDDEADLKGENVDKQLEPVSQNGLLFILLDLIFHWSEKNQDTELARNIFVSPQQRLGLAMSLRTLLHQLHTQEIDLSTLPLAYDLELSEHRQSILELLALIHDTLPRKLAEMRLATFASWRNQKLRREAQRLATEDTPRPIIVAGSTGTIPATRALLHVVSQHPMGAIVLPGLDLILDRESWENLPPEHPQFSMKLLMDELAMERKTVQILGENNSSKSFLLTELLRPTKTAENWHRILPANQEKLTEAIEGIRLIDAKDRHIEARAIALILRQALSLPSQTTAALVTPDRDLAARVRNELSRWNISIDDSAGFPLSKTGLAAVCVGLAEVILQNFDVASLFDLLKRPEVSLGLEPNKKETTLKNIEITVLRNASIQDGIAGLALAFARARAANEKGERSHPLVAGLEPHHWDLMEALINWVHETLQLLLRDDQLLQTDWLTIFGEVLDRLTQGVDESLPQNVAFRKTFEDLRNDSAFLAACSRQTFLLNLVQILKATPFRPTDNSHPNLAIYGTLEARLLPVDILILGGLNEGVWPSEPDSGPWLNRPMRNLLHLAQPEREIGLAAHDLVQGLGHPKVYLTWSRRISGTPKNPSRWILRLKNLLKGAGIPENVCDDRSWAELAQELENAPMQPHRKPRPRPGAAARPTQFSVTEIETLLRDPYAIYAKKVLKFEPLPELLGKSDARLRGILFHAAVADWLKQQRQVHAPNSLQLLREAGEKVLQPLKSDLEVSGFWVPAFERIAQWLEETETGLRKNAVNVMPELGGKFSFSVGLVPHALTARADRVDRLTNGSYRIIDYKTGEVPSIKQVKAGFSTQLLLEALILKRGGFKGLSANSVSELFYVKLSSGRSACELLPILFEESSIDQKAEEQFSHLTELLASYQSPQMSYVPRRAPKTEMQVLPYDHLSRFAEWILAEE